MFLCYLYSSFRFSLSRRRAGILPSRALSYIIRIMKKLILLTILAFVGLLTFSINVGMNHEGEPMANCIFMSNGEMQCDMDLTEHINTWEQFLVADWNLKLTSFVLMLLIFVPVLAEAYKMLASYFFELSRFSAAKFFTKEASLIRFSSPVFIGLYSGILQPKLYQKD